MQKQILREDPLVKRLAKEALKSSGSSSSEGGSSEVREPWLILHVGYKKGSRSEIEFSNIMYSGARLTQEALDEVKTICLWVEESWESADYIGAGGAKAHGTSKKRAAGSPTRRAGRSWRPIRSIPRRCPKK